MPISITRSINYGGQAVIPGLDSNATGVEISRDITLNNNDIFTSGFNSNINYNTDKFQQDIYATDTNSNVKKISLYSNSNYNYLGFKGQLLGDGTTVSNLIQINPSYYSDYISEGPTSVASNINFSSFSEYLGNFIGLSTTGLLYTWGNGSYGQLGTGYKISFISTPQQIGSTIWGSIYQGTYFNFALRSTDNVLFSWGYNNFGQLGVGDTNNRHFPTQIGSTSWSKFYVFNNTVMAIRSTDSLLFSWGSNNSGQLGSGFSYNSHTPSLISNTPFSSVSFSSGSDNSMHALALTTGGILYAWGYNNKGQLGDGTTNNSMSPIQIGSTVWSSIYTDLFASYAIRSTDNVLFTWGYNQSGQLGTGNTNQQISPQIIGSTSWSKIITKNSSVFAFRSTDGLLFNWGNNSKGQLGTGNTTDLNIPTQLGSTIWNQNPFFDGYTILIKRSTDNSYYIWGKYNQTTITSPLLSVNYSSTTWSFFSNKNFNIYSDYFPSSIGDYNIFSINSSSKLFGSGDNVKISSISSPITNSLVTPINNKYKNVILNKSGVSFYTSGGESVLALSTGNILFAWGNNANGQLGLGFTDNRHTPQQVGATTWYKISSYRNSAFGIRLTDGILFSWGSNTEGQLGTGNITQYHVPQQVGSTVWKDIFIGQGSNFGVRSTDGVIFGWGKNTEGQLGVGNFVNQYAPTVIGSTPWKKISSGIYVTFFLRNDGILFAAGTAMFSNGEMGIYPTTGVIYNVPTQISNTIWKDINIVSSSVIALDINGDLFTWGNNLNGRVGDGKTTNRLTPFKVPIDTIWDQIFVNTDNDLINFSLATTKNREIYISGFSGIGIRDYRTFTKIDNLGYWNKILIGPQSLIILK